MLSVLPAPKVSGGPPEMTFKAPGAAPAAATISPRARLDSDARGDGFSTTAQPAARAGATFTTLCMSGKFQGTMPPITPTDCHSFISVPASWAQPA